MEYMQSQIETIELTDELIHVLKTGSHSGFLTYDGIDVNGKRVADEILNEVNGLTDIDTKSRVSKISIVGYSLGGLISRYAIGVLFFQGFFDSIEPVNFITFCSPHVGVLTPGGSITVKLFNLVVPHVLAHSGAEMFLADKKRIDSGRSLPLLVWMSDPQSYFFKGLLNFKYKSLYANVMNDKRTCWFTSAISIMDPFKSMLNYDSSIYELDYIPGYEPTVVDIKCPIILRKSVGKESLEKQDDFHWLRSTSSWLRNFFQRKLNWIKFVGTLVVFTPIWGIYLASRSVYERVKLNRRVKTFFRDSSNDLLHLYNYDSSSNDDDEEDLFVTSLISNTADRVLELAFKAINSEKGSYHYSVTNKEANDGESEVIVEPLALSEEQILIIQNLNSLNWAKYPVLIRNTKGTHAASIVKIDQPQFAEGKLVIKHLINEVFKTS